MRSRSLSLAGILLLAFSLLAPMAMLSRGAVAETDASPPPIEPVDDEAPSGGLELQLIEDLGDGGQPDGLPREIVVGEDRFLFDRIVPRDFEGLTEVALADAVVAFAATTEAPFETIYLSTPDLGEGELARYLPEWLADPETACPADNAEFSGLDLSGTIYVFAGVESDLTTDALQPVAESDGQPIYADAGASPPFPELFFETGGGLQRFVLVEDGLPASLADSLALGGVEFSFSGDATGAIDPGSLTKVGCAGPYPVFISADAEEGDRFVPVGDRLYQFTGDVTATEVPVEPTEAPTEEPTEVPTEVPTEAPTEEPTEAPTEEPTEVPTEAPTEVPTEEPTEVPTEEPTEAPTEEPTEEPTEAPTEAPTEEPTEQPTEVPPTEAPTEVPATEEPTEVPPTEAPTEEPTDVPIEDPTSEPTQQPGTEAPTEEPAPTPSPTPVPTQQPQPPAIVPTLAPNVPPPPAVTAEPTIACTGSPGAINAQGVPANLPNRIQYGGIAYAFVGSQDPAEAGELTPIGCAGAFEVATTDQADRSEVLYLRYAGDGPASEMVYRFEAGVTYEVEFEVTGQAQQIGTDDQVFHLTDIWYPSIYSSTTVILFVADPEATAPDTIYAVNVSSTTSGDVIGEYQRVEGEETASDDAIAAAEGTDLHPDLTSEGVRYVLVNVYLPIGTTTNGFVTIFSAEGEEEADLVLGRDLRRLELFLYTVVPSGD